MYHELARKITGKMKIWIKFSINYPKIPKPSKNTKHFLT
jgi:hypothetical protein